MFRFIIIFFLFLNSLIFAQPIVVNEQTTSIDLLSKSKVYIDKSRNLTIKDMQNSNTEFKNNNKKILGFGYDPKINIWLKFTLKNNSNVKITKILEYSNSLTTDVQLFKPENNYQLNQEGLFHIKENRKTIKPTFNLVLNPQESKTYYIKAASEITTLIIKTTLFDKDTFYEKELQHQSILSLFFGAMIILAIYNLFIYFFTKDISYLYYVFYIFGISLHHSIYTGISNIYFSQSFIIKSIELSSLIVAIPIFALALFTKYFLQINRYAKLNKILNFFLILIPTSVLFFILTDDYDKYRNLFTLCLMFYLIFLTIFSVIKKNRQAYFILFGWCLIFIAILLMVLSSQGIFNFYQYYSYYVETSLLIEAIVFSIALADRINNLQKEKNEANEKLIIQEQNEKRTLANKVELKTKDLRKALDEKSILLKELNHRVKNNMQTIVSLIRLQNDEIENEKLNDVLLTIQNRINAMSHLHELLYKQDNISHINAYEYFDLVVEEIEDSYDNNITIHKNISTNLKMEQAIYCGLILNELITNSFKYAFPNKKGNIFINLKKDQDVLNLIVKDDGIGYKKSTNSNSLGLILIDTLSKVQLKGTIDINSSEGVEVNISWKEHNKN